MFGNRDIACAVLPDLFESGTDVMFQKENLFVCRAAGQIVGIILWHKGKLEWTNTALAAKINEVVEHEAGLLKNLRKEELEKSLENVTKQYVSPSNTDCATEIITLWNVCTDPNVRGLKIASVMLEEFLIAHKDDSLELCVLSKNIGAIKLYERNGFKKVGEEQQAYPERLKNHKRLVMRRE